MIACDEGGTIQLQKTNSPGIDQGMRWWNMEDEVLEEEERGGRGKTAAEAP